MAFRLPSSLDLTAIRASFMELGKAVESASSRIKSVEDLKNEVARALGYGDSLKLEVGRVRLSADTAAAKAIEAVQLAATAQEAADGKVTTYFQTDVPVGAEEGDLWFDTDNGNTLYRLTNSVWELAKDSDIASALVAAATAQGTADGKARVYYQAAEPASLGAADQGDLWVDTDDNLKVWAWTGSAWILAQDWMAAKATADSKAVVFYQATTPTATHINDLWVDTSTTSYVLRIWNGSSWIVAQDLEAIRDLYESMADDGILSASEKPRVKRDYDAILAEKSVIYSAMLGAGITTHPYLTAYAEVVDQVNSLSTPLTVLTDATIPDKAGWAAAWPEYYKQRAVIQIAISSAPTTMVDSVRTTNASLTTNPTFTADGASPASGSKVLLVAQTTPSQNGIWTLTYSGASLASTTIYPASGMVSGDGTLTNEANGRDSDTDYATLTPSLLAINVPSSAVATYSGFSHATTGGVLTVVFVPFCPYADDAYATAEYSVDGGSTWQSFVAGETYTSASGTVTKTATLSGVDMSLVKVRFIGRTSWLRYRDEEFGIWLYDSFGTGIYIQQVRILTDAVTSANWTLGSQQLVSDLSLIGVSHGTTYGGKKVICHVASDNAITLEETDGVVIPLATSTSTGVVKPSTGLSVDTEGAVTVAFGTSAGTACQGNDTRLSDARPASDVYAWAKASVKPTYTFSEIGSRPTTISGYGITDTLAQLLTGYAIGSDSALAATDTLLAAFGKVQGQLNAKQAAGSYQPLDADLTAIGALAGTSGLLKKTAANTWTLDTTAYLHTGNVGDNAATLQAAVASAAAPLVGTVAQRTAYVPATGTYPYWYATDELAPDGLYGSLRQWSGSAWGAAANPRTVTGRVVAGVISAGSIGAQALAADLAIVNVLRSTDYTQSGTGLPLTGFKLDNDEPTYKFKVGSGQFGTGIKIGDSAYTLGDTAARALTGIQATGATASDVIFWRGNNDPLINGGSPVIIDPIWAKDQTFAVGDRRMGGGNLATLYLNTCPYVYECTTAGAGLTTAQATAAAWSSATTYAAGALVTYSSRSYSSKVSGNLSHFPVIGGDAYWTDLGSVYGPQGTVRTMDSIVDGSARWKCVGWMWTSAVATSGCKPWARSAVVAVGNLMASDVGATNPGYLGTAEKLYGQPVGAQFGTSANVGATRIYRCVTAGTTSASSNGPSGTGTGIVDGTAVWDYWAENTGPEDRVQLWGLMASGASGVYSVIYEARIQPKTNKDNLDGLTHLEIEYLGYDGNWKGRSAMHNQKCVHVPSRKYYSPSTPAHIGNMVRVEFGLDSSTTAETNFYMNAAPFAMQAKLRIRLHNVSGSSAAIDYTVWAYQNICPTPYANYMTTAPTGGGGVGDALPCPEPWVEILTERGLIPAGEIVAGDVVLTRHELTGELGRYPVVQVVQSENETAMLTVRKVDVGGEESVLDMAFALNHRFVRDGVWTPLAKIFAGSKLDSTDGSDITVLDIQPRGMNQVVKITVDEAHTYATHGVLSHNIKILE